MVDRWRKLSSPAHRARQRDFQAPATDHPGAVAAAANPDEALIQFDGFLAGLPAGVQLFSLFEANPHLIDLLIDICGSAPGLARYLSRNAQVFDGGHRGHVL